VVAFSLQESDWTSGPFGALLCASPGRLFVRAARLRPPTPLASAAAEAARRSPSPLALRLQLHARLVASTGFEKQRWEIASGEGQGQKMTDAPQVPQLAQARAAARCGARRKSDGRPCQQPAMRNKTRCRLHGGKSTGPRTPEGLERARKARWQHGYYSAEAKTALREAREALRLLRTLLELRF
jgi:hypothetical protein